MMDCGDGGAFGALLSLSLCWRDFFFAEDAEGDTSRGGRDSSMLLASYQGDCVGGALRRVCGHPHSDCGANGMVVVIGGGDRVDVGRLQMKGNKSRVQGLEGGNYVE